MITWRARTHKPCEAILLAAYMTDRAKSGTRRSPGGERRARNPEYHRVRARMKYARRTGNRARARDLEKKLRTLPFGDPMDPGYLRLRYMRYADDHILGFAGPRAEAEQIKARLAEFLRETLGLELNAAKTLITHARSQRARFLGRLAPVHCC